ncbi:MAG: hypothetical protein IKE94_01195 [Aeriscardovia sp.]|nr:hypothetical protein [Aeriscardovia sp.]
MPRKPSKEIIDAHKASINPQDVLTAVLNEPECAELRQALIDNGLVQEIKEGE